MKTLIDQLAQYGAYHRDRRNIVTHFIGIPMIVVAVATLLARPVLGEVAGLPLNPALAMVVLTSLFYLRLDLRYGVVMTLTLALALAAGNWFAAQSTATWLGAGVGLFVVGWVFQFVGHFYEGRKPAFVDDIVGLIIGPLFVVAEAGFLLGLGNGVRQQVEARIGPTLIRERGAQSA